MERTINIVTLSMGEEYVDYTKTMVYSFLNAPIDIKSFCIVTDLPTEFDTISNYAKKLGVLVYVKEISSREPIRVNNFFNYNLKRFAIELGRDVSSTGEIIMWLDCDAVFIPEYLEDFNHALGLVYENSCVATRPSSIGDLKKEDRSMAHHKIEVFGLWNTNKYDKAHCINEQILIIEVGIALDKFLICWDTMARVCEFFSIDPHVEGVEMGISLEEAGITPEFPKMRWVSFYSNKTGKFFSYG